MSKNIKIQDGFVLFLDILGFGDHVKNLKDESGFREVVELLAVIKKETVRLSNAESHLSDLKALTFSDSIILTIPYNSRSEGIDVGCMVIIKVGGLFQNALINAGYLTRGYLSRGAYVHEEEVLVGPALIDAYENERVMGDIPFIAVDKNIIEDAQKKMSSMPDSWISIFNNDVIKRKDRYVIDFLNAKEDGLKYVQPLDQLKTLIKKAEECIATFKGDFEDGEEKRNKLKKKRNKWTAFLQYAKDALSKRS